jgi:hypothetical protein
MGNPNSMLVKKVQANTGCDCEFEIVPTQNGRWVVVRATVTIGGSRVAFPPPGGSFSDIAAIAARIDQMDVDMRWWPDGIVPRRDGIDGHADS